ncbi:MAG: hypothetical protein CO186_09970 [Zetaproteobacteria bacterium CG_4_9_14_3_um_filter_49_83]|nr:MAG: hypothetical protein AUJ56_07245 [Zetaproteobacteria bacterium CG1_02_49_23]PIQ34553.1 MAG: hypothetical protein COW62_01200 [Zetaproteobacteria bacterium CG17_big_fil_post_rev_8_21_14_2_50_50_13]PIV29409.1 MAG: hypothetical protein COS35_12135 [Zetaproteobacteria bacterium CG02_land_8_20_14_3_00_50_9]PIY56569.1 MAG: hypothetical protein COZ00_03450 [Zetaproteobacteria bacterium CG_4_10_14_0_8_um_filter_49_80]PJA34616.1 MAG: hypothetical protein CO186_09970 [Zetaproteobacteria bacterium
MNEMFTKIREPERDFFIPWEHIGFSLDAVRSQAEMDSVYHLTYECYLREGYCSKSETKRLIHYPHLDELDETTVLVVKDPLGKVVGTCSTTVDNPAGLHVDDDFHQQVDVIRKENCALASSWRIAVDRKSRAGAVVVKLLIEGSIAYWHTRSIDTCLMTFNPCHERFYARYMNCKTIARSGDIHGLSNAPAVLMRWDAMRCPFKNRLSTLDIQTVH